MKELSIEEKAKRYDEAKYIMKEYLESGNAGVIAENTIKKAFPEFKENEDERIKKIIKNTLQSYNRGVVVGSLNAVDYADCITWLEKHKTSEEALQYLRENHSSSEMSDFQAAMNIAVAKAYDKGYNDGLEKHGEQKPDDKIKLGKKYKCIASPRYSTFMIGKIYKPEDKFLCSLMNFCSDCFEPIEDGEQNPADKDEPKFKIGDEIKTKNEESLIITRIDRWGYWSEDLFICNFDDADNWELVEQKPAWSEDDQSNFCELRSFIVETYRAEDASRLITWLKSLKERYTWEPSEEQIDALNYVVNLMASSEKPIENYLYYNILKSLREKLKNLRKE